MSKPFICNVVPKWHNDMYANKLRFHFLHETQLSVYNRHSEFGSEPICTSFRPSTSHITTVLEVYGSSELGFYYLCFLGDETGHFSYVVLSLAQLNELSRKNILQYLNEEFNMSNEIIVEETAVEETVVSQFTDVSADTIAESDIGHGEPEQDETESHNLSDAVDSVVQEISTLRLWHIGPAAVIDLSQVVALWQAAGEFMVIFKGTSSPVSFPHDPDHVKDFNDLLASWELARESEIKLEMLSRNPGWFVN